MARSAAVPAIDIQGLSKRFGSVQAVSDLSFSVEAGRVTGFLGPNGAGKSTTLRMLLGLVHPNAGTATSVLMLGFVIEPTLLAVAPDVGVYGPFSGLPTAVQDIPAEDVGFEGVDLLSPGAATLGMLAWIGVLFAGGGALLDKRDLD